MIYQFPTRKKTLPPPAIVKPKVAREVEQLSGQVKGIDAAKGEERFAKELDKSKVVRTYYFRTNPTDIPKGMPGWLELDFLVSTLFGWRAFEIDEMEFVHRGQRKASDAVAKDIRRREGLAKKGIVVREIEHVDEGLLQNQNDARRATRNLQL